MSRKVLFNGAVLVRPGAATKIDASQFENIALGGLGTVALIGEADGGESRVVKTFTSVKGVKEEYLSGDLVDAAALVADPSNDPRITAGAQVIVCYKVNNGAQAELEHDDRLTFLDRNYGLAGNSITVTITDGGSSTRVVVIETLDGQGLLVTETSPSLGGSGKLAVQYTGAGTNATLTIAVTAGVMTLTTTVTAGPGGEDLTLSSANYPTLNALIRAIDAHPAYTCESLITNDLAFDPADLDAIVAVDIDDAETTLYARNFDVADWINNNSNIISCELTQGETGPVAVLAKTALEGGTYGTSDNTAWTNAFAALAGIRVNQVVPLVSEDGATTGTGTFTVSAILAALTAHCKLMSGTAGRNEREGWASVKMTKTNLISAANTQNSEHVCVLGQYLERLRDSSGEVEAFPYWSAACVVAGLRAGAPLGEPLTWKYISATGLGQDASWDPGDNDDVADLILNGVMVITEVPGAGFRVEKGITTYTKSDNDAFTEETIVQIWKAVAYDLRTALEDRFTGRPGNVKTVQQVPSVVVGVLEKFREAGALTDSIEDGTVTKAYRNIEVALNGDQMSVGATITPTPGINFILNTLVLVPARISA
jgi:hypothetical protein